MQRNIWGAIAALLFAALLMQTVQVVAQQLVPVRVNRWLEVQQPVGQVAYSHAGVTRAAQRGDRLQSIGDGVNTGQRSSTQLALDTGVGFVNVSENTALRVQELQVAPDNGRITRLQVTQGRVRLQVRPFTHQGSRLEIETPAGISGVRGTEFGVVVQPNGKTGLATLHGRVVSDAQGQAVSVGGGFQNFTIPGEAPTQPVPLRDDTHLVYQFERVIERGIRYIRLTGQVDPVNEIHVEGIPQVSDRNGQFSVLLPALSYPRYHVIVTTPLGKVQEYELAIPRA